MPPTQSVASPNFVRRAVFGALLVCSQPALAQEEESEPNDVEVREEPKTAHESQPADPDEAAAPAPRVALTKVQINSVGIALPSSSLERLIAPAVKRSFDLHFERTDHFQPSDLFRARAGSPAQIHVWVDTTSPGTARIYFANRDGTRYLVRDLQHAEPLNEMDREAIAQTIEWSLQALSEGTVGMTRAEAEALLSESSEDEPLATEPAPVNAPPPSWRRATEGWLPEVALLHSWTPLSKELLSTQGPTLRLGVDHITPRRQLGVSVSAGFLYPVRHVEGGVAVELETVSPRLGARYLGLGLARGNALGLRFGFGLDVVTASPEALDWDRYEAARTSRTVVPLLDGGLVWQLRAEERVRLETSLGIEVDFLNVDYDVTTEAGTQTLLSRWPVRPSAKLGVALF